MVAVIALAASGAFSSSSSHSSTSTGTRSTQSTPSATSAPATTATTPATKTFSDPKLGISFAYPASWNQLTLAGTIATFGIGTGAAQTACGLISLPNQGPASSSQEAQSAYVRGETAFAASRTKGFKVLAIEAEQGANITGVGYTATSSGDGYHRAFFFRGRNVYVVSCVTPPAELTQVDQQVFEPLLASVMIG